jgi:hypothetical protein
VSDFVPSAAPPGGAVTWSYDAEIDATYVRVGPRENPRTQRKATATVGLDANGAIVAMDVPVS